MDDEVRKIMSEIREELFRKSSPEQHEEYLELMFIPERTLKNEFRQPELEIPYPGDLHIGYYDEEELSRDYVYRPVISI